MSGLKGIGRLPRDTVRARRNAMKFASTFSSMLGDGLEVTGAGLIAIDLAATPGLEFTGGDLEVLVQSPLICDASGIGIDPGNGLAISGTELVVDLAANPGLEFSGGDLICKVAAPMALDATGIHLDFGTGLQNVAGVLKTKDSEIVHDNLSGVSGGAIGDYYHFTAVQHTDLTDAGDSALHYHATDRARANHTGTQLAATISDFDEAAQDAVGGILDDGTVGNIVFTYNDVGNIVSAVTQDGEIDHDALLNFVGNEHIDHTAVTLTAGDGLTGGGTIAANRTFAVDLSATPGLEISGAKLQVKVNGAKTIVREAAGIGFDGIYANTTENYNAAQSADTIQAAIDALPKYIASGITLTFQFADGTYTLSHALTFGGFWGGGSLDIKGNMAESGLHTNQAVILDFDGQSCHGIVIDGVSCRLVRFYNLHIQVATTADWNAAIRIAYNQASIYGYYNYLEGNSAAKGYGVYATATFDVYPYQNYMDDVYAAVYATSNTKLSSHENDDTGTPPAYGLSAAYNAAIGKRGTQPAGSTANEVTSYGGVIR